MEHLSHVMYVKEYEITSATKIVNSHPSVNPRDVR